MKFENLWDIPSQEEKLNLTCNVKEILQQQGQYLKKATDGKIFGKFRPIKTTNVIATAGEIAMLFSQGLEQEDEDTKGLKNAGSLYADQKYCFEIYNKSYKFRPLEVDLSPVYPIRLIIDEEIFADCSDDLARVALKAPVLNAVAIDSDEMLIEVLRIIFTSKKVRFILYRLQHS